eukprot:jgi/Botrbrau1/21119/Bobra.0061s0014.1
MQICKCIYIRKTYIGLLVSTSHVALCRYLFSIYLGKSLWIKPDAYRNARC